MIKNRDPKTGRMLATHGMRNTLIYRVFNDMVDRCCNRNSIKWKDYGGRGIFICAEWLEDRTRFFSWAAANGYQKGLQIDRKNNDGPYSPENCHWTTSAINCRNRRNAVLDNFMVGQIKFLLSEGYSLKAIGNHYGIDFRMVSCIKNGKTWKEIPPATQVTSYPAAKAIKRNWHGLSRAS
jgi:hypothetical protein